MPSRAPSYYHWSQDKPCTTNQTYGFDFRGSVKNEKRIRKDAFDYTRPFSNSAFFPAISHDSSLTAPARSRPIRPGAVVPPGKVNVFDINKGYHMGYRPMTERAVRSSLPEGVKLDRTVSAPPVYKSPESRYKEIFLWHTLSGSLVHAKNYPSAEQEAC